MPSSSKFPFSLQLGFRGLKKFFCQQTLGSSSVSYETQMKSFSKWPVQRGITLLRFLHASNLQNVESENELKVIFKKQRIWS